MKKELNFVDNPRDEFAKFITRLKLLHSKHPNLLKCTLANIFSMRFIGNKTHGDLAEIAFTEFIGQYMYDYSCVHVGKEFFRSKEHEEDIAISEDTRKSTQYIPISLKAYGIGPLQLSTDKESTLYEGLEKVRKAYGNDIKEPRLLAHVMQIKGLKNLTNVLPLIYEEKELKRKSNVYRCNILLFKPEMIAEDTERIVFLDKEEYFDYEKGCVCKTTNGNKRKHPIYLFLNGSGEYICEVRYGGKDNANALQRGLWTNTKNAKDRYFEKFFDTRLSNDRQDDLIKLIGHSLITSTDAHKEADKTLMKHIKKQTPPKDDK